jgi:hypothetical protein
VTDIEKKPSLRISPYVFGRAQVKNKVNYLIDPKGEGTATGTPERVVLTRWRQRKFPDHSFSGEKLSSTLWRAVARAYGKNAEKICKMSLDKLQSTKLEKTETLNSCGFLKLPAASTLLSLFQICGPQRIQVLLDKHTSKEHDGKSGVPDLFLYATNKITGKPAIARFVEVKKPDEKISPEQRAEIALLNSMGLHARVMRLIEKPTKKPESPS